MSTKNAVDSGLRNLSSICHHISVTSQYLNRRLSQPKSRCVYLYMHYQFHGESISGFAEAVVVNRSPVSQLRLRLFGIFILSTDLYVIVNVFPNYNQPDINDAVRFWASHTAVFVLFRIGITMGHRGLYQFADEIIFVESRLRRESIQESVWELSPDFYGNNFEKNKPRFPNNQLLLINRSINRSNTLWCSVESLRLRGQLNTTYPVVIAPDRQSYHLKHLISV